MLIDTTVFVDLFREKREAQKFLLQTSEPLRISRVVLMELIRGLRSKREIKTLVGQLEALGVEIIEIDEAISKMAGELFEKYYHSHGLGIMDALVAASTLVAEEKLITHNKRHFHFIPRIILVVPY